MEASPHQEWLKRAFSFQDVNLQIPKSSLINEGERAFAQIANPSDAQPGPFELGGCVAQNFLNIDREAPKN